MKKVKYEKDSWTFGHSARTLDEFISILLEFP